MLCFFMFVSSRRRHTRCALVTGVQTCALPILGGAKAFRMKPRPGEADWFTVLRDLASAAAIGLERLHGLERGYRDAQRTIAAEYRPDRKSVVKGKSVSVRVDLGGRRIIKKKNSRLQTRRSMLSHTTITLIKQT